MPEKPEYPSIWRSPLSREREEIRSLLLVAGLLSDSDHSEPGVLGGIAAIIANQEKLIASQEELIASQERLMAK